MTQIEQIKAEIERRYNQNRDKLTKLPEYCDEAYHLRKICSEDRYFRDFINSLPSEQPSEELVDAARNIRDTLYLEEGKRDVYGNPYFLQDTILKAVIAGANWQREQTISKACEWLNKNVVEYHPRKGELRPIVNINAFREAMEDEQ